MEWSTTPASKPPTAGSRSLAHQGRASAVCTNPPECPVTPVFTAKSRARNVDEEAAPTRPTRAAAAMVAYRSRGANLGAESGPDDDVGGFIASILHNSEGLGKRGCDPDAIEHRRRAGVTPRWWAVWFDVRAGVGWREG